MAVEAVVSVVIQQLTNLLTEESKLFVKVSDEVQDVLEELRLQNNAEHQEQSKNDLKFLNKVYRVGDAIESFALTETYLKRKGFVKKHSLIISSNLKLCREVPDERNYSENISRLKSEMNRIRKEIQKREDGSPSPEKQQGSHSLSQQERRQESYIYSPPKREKAIFTKDVEDLVKQLTSQSKPRLIISIFGEVGIGKTAHVKTIYNTYKGHKEFSCSAMVSVKKEWLVRDLIMAILQQVDRQKGTEKLKDDVLRWRLHDFLMGQRYLIVVRNIQSRKLLEELSGALPDAYNRSRVVITTSNEKTASFADASNRYHFKPLDMEGSLKFFISKIWGKRGIPFTHANMEDLKNKIAESCKGTPLRIELLAGLLSTRELIYKEWSLVFEQRDFATKSPLFDMLVFCYNDVPMHLKPCLLYLTLFRKGFEIPVRRLFRLWLAEGFVNPSTRIIPEDIVEGYLEELVKRNMVEITKRRSDESPKKCRLIGALHDILLPKALKLGLFHLHQKPDEQSNATVEHNSGTRRVVEFTNIKDYSTSKAFNQNIHSYISFNGRKKDMPAEEVGTFLKRIIGVRGFGLLKVLDLEGVYRPRLPENLGSLFHLRYLGLRWTFLDTLPSSVGGLLYLETLDIKHTHITTLPSSIWNMKHLHHLCLNGARLDISAQSAIHKGPSQLQTLWGLFVDEKIARKIGSTLRRMTDLRKLDITGESFSTMTTMTTTTTTTTTTKTSAYEEIGSWILLLSSLQSLRLRSKDKMGRPSELIVKPFSRLQNLSQLYLLGHLREAISWYQIPPGLKVLTLSVSKLGEDPMPTLSQLPNLMVLRLLAASYVGDEMHCPENGFPSLRVLRLWKLEELKILTVHEGTMQKLHTMEIKCCRKLKEFPLTLLHIQNFDNLILTNMPKPFVSAIRKKKKKHTKIVEIEENI
ncbi:putative virus X resistance protein-like, coiled-coil [Helianthus debilis subsp. tardiflorus]